MCIWIRSSSTFTETSSSFSDPSISFCFGRGCCYCNYFFVFLLWNFITFMFPLSMFFFIFASFTHKRKHSNQFVTWNEYLYTILLYFFLSLCSFVSILSRFSLYLISFYLKRSSFFPHLLVALYCNSFSFVPSSQHFRVYFFLRPFGCFDGSFYTVDLLLSLLFFLSRYIPYRNSLNDTPMLSSNLLLSRNESIIRKNNENNWRAQKTQTQFELILFEIT